MHRIAVGLLGLLLLVATACASGAAAKPAPSHTPAPAAAKAVEVGEGDMYLHPSATVVAAGSVTFTVANNGPSKHEFVIVSGDPTGTTGEEAGRVSEANHIGGPEGPEIGNIPPGGTKVLTVDLPPGTYTAMCNLPGHYAGGMKYTFVVN
jgi:uncharacterized cupredoxin-like copper-binding protein